MNEREKYETIKSLAEHGGNKRRAALRIGCTVRTVNRMLAGYGEKGKEFFMHGNRGRKPAYTLKSEAGFKTKKAHNAKLEGASLAGRVTDVATDTVKLRLYADDDSYDAGAKWLNYSTVYSSPDMGRAFPPPRRPGFRPFFRRARTRT